MEQSEYQLRLAAAGRGEKKYLGKPCLEHAGNLRYTSNGACVECTRVRRDGSNNVIRELLKKNS